MNRSCGGSIVATLSAEMTPSDVVAARARALWRIGRTADALEAVRELLSDEPDSADGLALMGLCLVGLRRDVEAERVWKRATALHPDNIEIAILGVRCAWSDRRQVWTRTERLRSLAPNDQNALFWIALVAARTNRQPIADNAVSRLRGIDPVGDQPRLAEAWVDLLISRRTGRPAETAERITKELLGKNPQNVEAHDLRIKAASLRSVQPGSRRDAAIDELRAISDAAAAGVPAEPGRMRALTALTVGAPALGAAYVVIALLGHFIIDVGAIPWPIPALCIAIVWSWSCTAACRRVMPLVRVLPAVGRPRLLKPVVQSAAITASLLSLAGIAALVGLQPYNEARAIEIGFASQIETRTFFEWVPQSFPVLIAPVPPSPVIPRTFPTVPRPRVPSTLVPGGRPIPTFAPRPDPLAVPVLTPPPTFIVEIPRERSETTTTTDPATALALMRYWIVMAALAICAGGGLLFLAHLARQGHRNGPSVAESR